MTAFIILFALFGAWLGASVASFLCVVAERVPRGEGIGGRSHCICGRQLTWWENVPVLSWLILRGRSRCCDSAIPGVYVRNEVLAGLFGGLAGGTMAYATFTGHWLMAAAALVLAGVIEWGLYESWKGQQGTSSSDRQP